MPAILTSKDAMACEYQGKVAMAGTPKLVVLGGEALIASVLKSCAIPDCHGKEASQPVCTIVSGVEGGAGKLYVAGEPVLLPATSVESKPGPHKISLQPGSPGQTKLVTL